MDIEIDRHPRTKPLQIGGVMRCCVETLDSTPVQEVEGEVLPCKYCSDSLIFMDEAWGKYWDREAEKEAIQKPL